MPTAVVSAQRNGAKREKRDGGSVAPSRTAAIGGTRVARIAGTSPAKSVMRMPASRLTTMVRGAKTMPAWGMSKPMAAKIELRPLASARPRNRPVTDASAPITSASTITESRTCRRDAPIVRSVANSRTRWATVIDSVLKMTKAPTKRAMMPNASKKYWMMFVNSSTSWVASWVSWTPVCTWVLGGRIGSISWTSCSGLTPSLAAIEMPSSMPSLSNSS